MIWKRRVEYRPLRACMGNKRLVLFRAGRVVLEWDEERSVKTIRGQLVNAAEGHTQRKPNKVTQSRNKMDALGLLKRKQDKNCEFN